MTPQPLKIRRQFCILQKLQPIPGLLLDYLQLSIPWDLTKAELLSFLKEMQDQRLVGIHEAHNTVTGERVYRIYITAEAITWMTEKELV